MADKQKNSKISELNVAVELESKISRSRLSPLTSPRYKPKIKNDNDGCDLNAIVAVADFVNKIRSPTASPCATPKSVNHNDDEHNKFLTPKDNNIGSSTSIGIEALNTVNTSIPDVNIYQQKKTLAQGMMDIALLSANANQLRYVFESRDSHPYYYTSLFFISLSITLQIAVGLGLILNSRYNVKKGNDMFIANKINNFTVIGIFSVTVVNVFISVFGVATPSQDIIY